MTAAHLEHDATTAVRKPGRHRAILLVGLFLLSMASELTIPTLCHWWYKPDGEEPFIAEHLYHGHGFLSPLDFSATAPPSSWSPPVYPVVLSLFYRAFGLENQRLILALRIFHAAIFGLVTLGLFRLGETLASPAVGTAAAVGHALFPSFLHSATEFWDNYPALAIFVWVLVAVALLRQRRPTLWNAAGLGVALGVLSLTDASYALAYPVLVLVAAAGRPWRGRLSFSAIAVLCFLLTLAPWTIRNYRAFGRLFYVRGGVKFDLWCANQPMASGWFGHANRMAAPTHNRRQRDALLNLGETQYFDDRGADFMVSYRAHPRAFWARTGRRAVFFFVGEPIAQAESVKQMNRLSYILSGILGAPLNFLLTCMGTAGAVMAWRLRWRCGWLLAAGGLAVVPFLVTYVLARYLLPLRLVFLFFATALLVAGAHRLRFGAWPTAQPLSGAEGFPV